MSTKKRIDSALKDLKRQDYKALLNSFEVITHLIVNDLNGYVGVYLIPCFPKYYLVF
jgi:hypothetical protein